MSDPSKSANVQSLNRREFYRAITLATPRKRRRELVRVAVELPIDFDREKLREQHGKVIREVEAEPAVLDESTGDVLIPEVPGYLLAEIPYEVRAPSLAAKQQITEAAVKLSTKEGEAVDVKVSELEFKVQAALACVYVPNTDQRVFEEADLDALRAGAVGSWYQVLIEAAHRITQAPKAEEAKARLSATPSGSSSSR